jgi:hypothetical protein
MFINVGSNEYRLTQLFCYLSFIVMGERGSLVVKTPGYVPEGRGFETR